MNNPIDFLNIEVLGIEASAGGQFAIAAVVVIVIATLAVRRRR